MIFSLSITSPYHWSQLGRTREMKNISYHNRLAFQTVYLDILLPQLGIGESRLCCWNSDESWASEFVRTGPVLIWYNYHCSNTKWPCYGCSDSISPRTTCETEPSALDLALSRLDRVAVPHFQKCQGMLSV